jgi:5'-3' exonuclease
MNRNIIRDIIETYLVHYIVVLLYPYSQCTSYNFYYYYNMWY